MEQEGGVRGMDGTGGRGEGDGWNRCFFVLKSVASFSFMIGIKQ